MKTVVLVCVALIALPLVLWFGGFILALMVAHPWVTLGVGALTWAARHIKEERAIVAASAPPRPPARPSRFGYFFSYFWR